MDNNNFFKALTLGEDVKLSIKTLSEVKIHFDVLLSNNIIQSNRYNDIMDKIKFINNELFNQAKTLKSVEKIYIKRDKKIMKNRGENNKEEQIDNDFYRAKITSVELNYKVMRDEILKMINEYGFNSISKSLEIISNDIYKKYELEITSKLNIIDNFFQVTKIEKKSKKFEDDVFLRIKNILPDPIKTTTSSSSSSSSSNNDKSNYSASSKLDSEYGPEDKITTNLIYELSKAIIEIDIGNMTFVFGGFFREDSLNEIYNHEPFRTKFLNIKKKAIESYLKTEKSEKSERNSNLDDKFKFFVKEYIEQLELKNFIVNTDEMIINKIKSSFALFTRFEKMPVIDLLNNFVSKNIYAKREMIQSLLINAQSVDLLAEQERLDDFSDSESESEKSDDSEQKLNSKNFENNIVEQTENKDEKDEKDEWDTIVGTNNIKQTDKSKQITQANKENGINPNPLPLVKFNKTTATRYSINSIMKNFDSRNDAKNLTSIIINSKKILNANVLMDFLKNSILTSDEYDNFLKSLHWNIRKKIFAKKVSDFSIPKKTEEISWETKLSLMDITEKAKDKVNEKIKEVRSSKDNSKAETFIESFFKIPFGTFIKEDIFIKSSNSVLKIKKHINAINNVIDKKEDMVGFSDSLETIKKKTLTYRLLNDIEEHYFDLIDEKKQIIEEKNKYLEKVDKILEDAIYGHLESKREIKRLIAQWMGGRMEGMVLGFHGPPGVGKTCFAKKGIAKCLFDSNGNSRPFCIFQLGGATDGSILEGHSYTYVGAKPGRLVEFLQETKCMNPIIYFDELDKVSETDKGKEIIDILIHLTDKSQNKEIFDKYFSGIELDFSKCIIIFSYNDASKVNRILRDRITEIKINPLKKAEKIIITKNYTLKEISDELNYNCEISDELIEYIIDTYTMESGIRKLNEKLYQIFREINLRVLENPWTELELTKDLIDEILTRHYKIKHYKIHRNPSVGLINGLYASTVGLGGITLIQIKKILTTSNSIPLELTGQQGDVMKESMQCAKTLALNLINKSERDNITEELKTNPFGLHIHCPDGATPKDGPSAGITITAGIYSVLTNKPVRNDVAMTGEVDLMGNVKAIGGLDAKINGAIKAGVKFVIFPKENEQDWIKIQKENVLDGEIEIFMAENIEEVIQRVIIH